MLSGRGGRLRTFIHPILETLRTYEVSRTRREVYDRVVEHLGAAGVAVPCPSLIWLADKELKVSYQNHPKSVDIVVNMVPPCKAARL